jgi:hypothetical protein
MQNNLTKMKQKYQPSEILMTNRLSIPNPIIRMPLPKLPIYILSQNFSIKEFQTSTLKR